MHGSTKKKLLRKCRANLRASFEPLELRCLLSGTPFYGTPFSLPATIQAEDYDKGGESVAYHDNDAANLGGAYRLSEGVDVEPTADTGGGYNVGHFQAGEWMTYTVSIPTAGQWTLNERVASNSAGGNFHVEVDGASITGPVNLPNTGGWQVWKTLSQQVALPSGQHVVRVFVDTAPSGDIGNLNWISFTNPPTGSTNQPPVVSAGANQTITLGSAATLNGSATDDGLPNNTLTSTWSLISGPGAVSFANAASPQTTATFSANGSYVLKLSATDSQLTSSATTTVTVNPISSVQSVNTFTLINADTNVPVAGFDPFTNGAVLNLATLSTTHLNVRANTNPTTVGSVVFSLDGNSRFRVETFAPYALAGDDNNGHYFSWTPAAGSHTLTATPFTAGGGGGTAGTALSISFTVTNNVTPPPNNTFAWQPGAAAPVNTFEAQSAVVNGKLFQFGGFDPVLNAMVRSDVYDPNADSWTRIADMPEAVTHGAVTVVDSRVYIAGGYVGQAPGPGTAHVWIYDTVANTWSAGISLPDARAGGGLGFVGRTLYFYGGINANRTIDEPTTWSLNVDSGTIWTQLADMPNPRNHLGAATLNGKLYAIGGQHLTAEMTGNQAEVDVYDPSTNLWSVAAPMPAPRSHISPATFVRNGRIDVIGGEGNGNGHLADFIEFDPTANAWAALPSLPLARKSAIAAAIGNRIIVTTGEPPSGPTLNTTLVGVLSNAWETGPTIPVQVGEVAGGIINGTMYLVTESTADTLSYNVATGTWANPTALAQRPFPGDHHAAEVINNKLYLFGGLDFTGVAGAVQIYDPVANTWTMGAPMPFATGSCSTALINGLVYCAGGIVNHATTSQAAVYNPATNTWASIAPMPQAVNHAASSTDGKKLYVFGGRAGDNTPSNGFNYVQIYDPTTNTWTSSANSGSTIAPLPQARGGMGKSVYYNGEFYIFGGETATGLGATPNNVYNLVNIYNPLTNTWRAGAPMPTPRHGIFPLLYDGRIFVPGGGAQSGFSLSTIFEIYNPA
ncbi:MAG: carbohydrate-binding protein [Planctomycetota bacterium]|nr:carbohydrate-binding protein [Planctomycetota bacterium]